MTKHPTSARTKRHTWLKLALFALLPLGLGWAIRERASWRPRVLPGTRANVFQVAFSSDGKYLAVASQSDEVMHLRPDERFPAPDRKFDDAVDIWDAQGRALLHSIQLKGKALGSIAFSPDGHSLAGLVSWRQGNQAGHQDANEVRIWDAGTGEVRRTLRIGPAYSHHLRWREGALSFHGGRYGFWRWDAGTGRRLPDKPSDPHFIFSLALSPDESLAASFSSNQGADRRIEVRDAHSGEVKSAIRDARTSDRMATSRDNSLLAVVGDDRAIRLWSLPSGALVRTLRSERELSGAPAFSPDGAALACGNSNGAFTIWRVP